MKIYLVFQLFLGLASHVYAEACPQAEDIHPCICEEGDTDELLVTCTDKSLNLQRLKTVLNKLSTRKNVDLELHNIELGTVPSNFFSGVYIKRLEISSGNLDALSDDGRPALLGLEHTLEELTIVSSFYEEYVPAKLQVGHLVTLKELELSFNVITELGDDWFEHGPASLEYLTISNNGIEKIGSKAFANLDHLKQLSLDGNRFGPILRSMLPNAGLQFEALELNNNALTDLPDDIFTSMPVLSSVSLRDNGIARLDKRIWFHVWDQLDVLSLEGNPIYCDAHMNWIFEFRMTSAIYGECHFPKELEGHDLQDFIDSGSRNQNL